MLQLAEGVVGATAQVGGPEDTTALLSHLQEARKGPRGPALTFDGQEQSQSSTGILPRSFGSAQEHGHVGIAGLAHGAGEGDRGVHQGLGGTLNNGPEAGLRVRICTRSRLFPPSFKALFEQA